MKNNSKISTLKSNCNMETKNATPNLITLLNSLIAALNAAYPEKNISLSFNAIIPVNGGSFIYTHLWDAPDGKLYLWAMQDTENQITFMPTDTDEIDDAGICTRELTTPEGLHIIIAEDF